MDVGGRNTQKHAHSKMSTAAVVVVVARRDGSGSEGLLMNPANGAATGKFVRNLNLCIPLN